VVIPTFDRKKDLEDTLNLILRQTKLPKEIIIVDDSDNYDSRDLIERIHEKFLNKGITLKYLRKDRKKGASISKNMGAKQATGQVVLFLDDDVILGKKYIQEILNI